MDSRYHSPVIYQDTDDTKEPEWDPFKYVPSTWFGGRAPHVLFEGEKTSILDLYGREWTLVEFASSLASPSAIPLHESRRSANIPLTLVHIEDEDHMRRIWERSMVLVRPNGHVT
jgi:FAD-dependent monooxygenase